MGYESEITLKQQRFRKKQYLKYLIKIRITIQKELLKKLNNDIVSIILGYCMFEDTFYTKLKIPKFLKLKEE
jgi:hypothetical protein